MERPFFSLSRQRRSEPIEYEVQNGAATITVNVFAPSPPLSWAFTMRQLHHKSGSTQRVADFAKELRRAVERQRLPGYWLELLKNTDGEEVLHFTERCQLPTGHPGFQFQRLPRAPMGMADD